ncbi:MAG: ABC transporter permease [Firmicutes bacterium]|nr:ABC transporter permease [Bacillota bacterium]MCL5038458.1 ABC transporter permease [Bacillota bacterium]
MTRYIVKRAGYMIATLWVIITLTFVLMHALPGDPFLNPKKVPEPIRQNMLAKYGLDKPLYQQYFIYLENLSRGELGYSLRYTQRTVNDMIRDGFPYSADLGVRALIFAITTGLTLGIIAALNHNRGWDYTAMLVAVFGVSVPNFVVGTLLQYLISVKLRLLPVTGWEGFKYTLLPSFALGLWTVALMARMMRTTMLEVLNQDYIKTAKAKGLSSREIVWRHAIRNAILPVVTILGPLVVNIITGTLVIETIFAIPGLGRYYVQSINNLDYPLIMGTTIFYAALLILAIFLVDIAYSFIDPRIRLVGGKE